VDNDDSVLTSKAVHFCRFDCIFSQF